MADNNREGYLKLGYEVDQGSINAVNQANAKVEASLAAVQKSTAGVTAAADQAGKSLKDAFSRSEGAIKADQKAVDDLRKSLGEAAQEADKVSKAGGGSGGIAGISGLRRTGSALSQLGLSDVGGAVSRAGDIQQVIKEASLLGDAFQKLPAPLGAVAGQASALAAPLGATAAGLAGVAIVAAPIALALADVAIWMKLLQDSAERAGKAEKARYEQEVEDINRLAEVRRKARAESSQQSAQETADLVAKRADEQKELDRLKAGKAQIDADYAALGGAFDPKTRGDLKAAGEENQKAIDAQLKKLDDLNQQFISNTQELDPLIAKHEAERKAVSDLVTASDAKASADKLQKDAIEQITAATANHSVASLKDEQAVLANIQAAGKAADERIAQNRAQVASNNALIEGLQKLGPNNEAATAKIKDLQEQNAKLAIETEQLVKVAAPLIKQRQDEAAADVKAAHANAQVLDSIKSKLEDGAKKAEQAGKAVQKAIDEALADRAKADERVATLQQKFNDQSAAIEARDKEARLSAFQKYEDTVAGIEQKSLEARADLQTKYADQLVDIAQRAADDAAKALKGLQQKQADLRTGLGRDEEKAGRDAADKVLDIQIKSQREERTALEEHLQRVKEIRQGDYVQDQKDLLDRNFQAIYLRRLGQTQQIEQENTKFTADRRKREQTITDEVQDAQRQAQITRRERLIAFEQANADAKLAYQRERQAAEQARQIALRDAAISRNRELEQQRIAKQRELAAANQAYQRELNDLTAKLAREKVTLSNAYDAELKTAALYGKARVEAEKKTQQALLDQANVRLRALQGGSSGGASRPAGHGVAEFAGGGYMEAGQIGMVNEPGSTRRESFNGVPLPGAGLFIPSQAGYVNPNGEGVSKSVTNTNTFYIQAHDTEGVKREVISVLRQVMG